MDDLSWQMPPELEKAGKCTRLYWHKQRVQRELPAFQLLDELDSGLNPGELRCALEEVRDEIDTIEDQLRTLDDPYFNAIADNLVAALQNAETCRDQRVQALQAMTRQHVAIDGQKLRELRTQEADSMAEARRLQRELCGRCQRERMWYECRLGLNCVFAYVKAEAGNGKPTACKH